MKAVVLCPGPSLADLKSLPQSDVSIGVNRAVLAHHCDWLVAGDYPFLREYDFGYTLKLFTSRATKVPRPERFSQVLHNEDLSFPQPPAWRSKSVTLALVLAAYLGATQIDLFGADMAGTADWDGHEYQMRGYPPGQAQRDRSPQRWDLERVLLSETIQMLSDRGIVASVSEASKRSLGE